MLSADLEFASLTPVVAASTESKIQSPTFYVLSDSPITFTVEGAAIAKVRATRENEQRTRRRPGFLDDSFSCDCDDRIARREKAAKAVETMPNGFDGTSITLKVVRRSSHWWITYCVPE